MKPIKDHKSHLRLAVVQQLRIYGIKIKHWNSKQRLPTEGVKVTEAPDSGKTFGTPLQELPHIFVQDYGNIPSFVVSACKHLELHVSTEGLFRKSGSVVRLKALKNKLDVGDCCLAAAPPCDVAGLLKQFFRELPEPILKPDLHDAFFKAQQLGSEEEKTAATLLVSCLMSDHTIETLQYFFGFLRRVSLRSDENKMDSSNLAVIFAPNLLQSGDGSEKMSASTEKKLRLQAAVVRTLIDNAAEIGRFPDSILEKVPAMLGVDAACATPMLENYEDGEWESPGERKRKLRRSVGDMFSEALNKLKTNRTPTTTPQADRNGLYSMVTPVVLTPSTKRKLPADSCQGFSNKKMKSLKHNLGFDFLPSSLFSGSLTPASAQSDASPCLSLENSQNSPSLFIIGAKHLSSSRRQRNKRYENKKIHRVESGKTGCFSPKITRKEMVRRSLRLKFSLGKSSRENLTGGFPSTSKSENIGWRLANQQEVEQEVELSKSNAPLSPAKAAKRGSKIISKSEENLLTPKCSDGTKYRMSWTGPCVSELPISDNGGTPLMGYLNPSNFYSEPVLVAGKPPAIPCELRQNPAIGKPVKCPISSPFSGEEKHMAEKTLLMIKKAFSETGSDLRCIIADSRSSLKAEEKPSEKGIESKAYLQATGSETVMQISPATEHCKQKLNLKMAITDASKNPVHTEEPSIVVNEDYAFQDPKDQFKSENCVTRDVLNSAPLMSESDTCPPSFNSHDCMSCEQAHNLMIKETEFKLLEALEDQGLTLSAKERDVEVLEFAEMIQSVITGPDILQSEATSPAKPYPLTVESRKPKSSVIAKGVRVSDHIQRFNKLSLNDHGTKKVKSPLNFERTPVRQSVRRINSLSEIRKQTSDSMLVKSNTSSASLQKSVSCSSTFASRVEQLAKNSAPHNPCPVSLNIQPASAPVMQRNLSAHRTLRSKVDVLARQDGLGTNSQVNEHKVGIAMQSKSVLEDLTNQEAPRTAGKGTLDRKPRTGNTVAAITDIGLARKLSGKEKNRYKGSPKNPIAKTQLLPTSRPLEL